MSDLISRSKLLKEIETWGGCVEALHEYISNMPTAYNVDAVVEQLEEMFGVDPMYYGAEARWAVDKAIEIVKAGGTNGNNE